MVLLPRAHARRRCAALTAGFLLLAVPLLGFAGDGANAASPIEPELPAVALAAPDTAPRNEAAARAIAGGGFFPLDHTLGETGTTASLVAPGNAGADLGYAVLDEPGGPPFWSSYQRLAGAGLGTGGEGSGAGLGLPVSRPFLLPDAQVYQAFQYGVLVWRPGADAAEVAPIMDLLSAAGLDEWLKTRGIPPADPVPASVDSTTAIGVAFARLDWLTDAAIRAAYFGGDDRPAGAFAAAFARFGLPMSPLERSDSTVTQRFQRGVLRVDTTATLDGVGADAAGQAAGQAARVPVGTLLRDSGLLTDAALAPDRLVGGLLVARAPRAQLAWRSDIGWGVPLPAGAPPPAPAAQPAVPAAAPGGPPTAVPTGAITPTPTPAPAPAAAQPQPGAIPGIRDVVNQGRAEHVVLANDGTAAQDLTGWVLRSAGGGQTYAFPAGFVLAPGATVNVHSGAGDPAALHQPPSDLFATRTNVWRNTGDVAQLVAPGGRVVSEFRYGAP